LKEVLLEGRDKITRGLGTLGGEASLFCEQPVAELCCEPFDLPLNTLFHLLDLHHILLIECLTFERHGSLHYGLKELDPWVQAPWLHHVMSDLELVARIEYLANQVHNVARALALVERVDYSVD
jgi:hypothetical protein